MIGGIMTIERYRSRRDGARPDAADPGADNGLGLIEIIVSMFLISLLAIAFIPVMVSAIRASTLNSTVATATRLVSQAVNEVREAAREGRAPDCASAQLLNAQDDEVDAQGVTLRVTTTVPALSSCVDNSVITITVVVVDLADATATPIADARTQIFLDGTP